jgi:hypothetical protein
MTTATTGMGITTTGITIMGIMDMVIMAMHPRPPISPAPSPSASC